MSKMDLSFLEGFMQPLVLAGCLGTGYVVKKWVKDVENKYIPTIMFVEGAVLNCVVTGSITIETIIAGAICGLASTGMHQAFSRLMEGKTEA